ncbi:uncharacterized protein LOC133157209 [Syngnathus typhle]|uniref:uncharacterized protein LOC133157209 n=1 Tax=Syngnathus typhle TaxID=161592 RepID=UPI002A6ADBAE|nr:uncharacterized protein LOC133157209 [Syngnathus typhle]
MAPSFAAWLMIALALRLICIAVSVCPSGWQEYSNHCYFFGTNNLDWDQAEHYCVSKGGHLASIRDRREQEWVALQALDHSWYWIGLRRAAPGSTVWQWTDGTPFSYSYWDIDQPDHYLGQENCGEIQRSYGGSWNDYPCDFSQGYICKVPRDKRMCANATNGASCSSRDVACQCQLYMKYSDTGGFQGGLGGLSVGRTLVIKGQSIPQATKLVINMDVRDSSGKETGNNALHLNIDFGTKSFTMNTKVSGKLGENLTGNLPQQNPFGPGLPFEIVIKCGSGAFQLTFNGGPQQDFAYQVQDLQAINLLLVWQVEQIHVQLK